MTTLERAASLYPKLLHNLETHYHNIETLYTDNLSIDDIRIQLQIPYDEWLQMEDIIFAKESVYRCSNVIGETIYYKGNNIKGNKWEIKDGE